jgi:TRAP-type C4-dicarboxylate transport system permease small subunit
MVSRLFAVTVPGMQDFAGYCVAGTTFLALGTSLRAGSQIRVNLLLAHLGRRSARLLELWCCGLGVVVSAYIAYWSADLVWDSYQYGEVASTLVSTPLWIPRLTMALGSVVLFVAFVDELVHLVRGGRPRYEGQVATES